MSNNALQFNVTSHRKNTITSGSDARTTEFSFQFTPFKAPHPSAIQDKTTFTRVIAVADVDLNEWLDIIVCNNGQPNKVLLNRGKGVYEEIPDALPQNDNSATTTIAIGDINLDGFPDLIMGNFGTDIKLFLNQRNGTFQEAMGAIPGGSNTSTRTTSIALADVNSDGYLDLVVGNHGQPNVLFLNTHNNSFQEAAGALPQNRSLTQAVAVADVNSDGLVDIIIGNELQPNQLLLNKGNASFEEVPGALPDDSFITSAMEVADINGDQHIDLIIANFGAAEPNQLLLNQGDGTFKEVSDAFPSNDHNSMTIAVADMDGDGRLDILIGTGMNQQNELLLNQGDSTFKGENGTLGPLAYSIAVADVDGDGRVDFLIGNHNASNYAYLNKENFAIKDMPGVFPDGSSKTRNIAVADLNGDGVPDMVIGNFGEPNQVLLTQAQDGRLQEVGSDISLGNTLTSALAIGDLDGDGMPDIVIGNRDQSSNQVMINKGAGKFEEGLSIPGEQTSALALADVNADGRLDIIVATRHPYANNDYYDYLDDYNPYDVTGLDLLLINQGDGTFEEITDAFPTASNTTSIAVADVNDDGFIDIIFGRGADETNMLLLNQGDGTFQEKEGAIPGTFNTWSIAVADLNGDGLIDIVVGNYWDPNQVLLNRGDGTFEEKEGALPRSIYTRQTNTRSVALVDFDGDDRPDVVIGNEGNPNQILLNKGDGTFYEIDHPEDSSPTYAVAVGDFDQDGRMDFIIGNFDYPNHLFVFSECPYGGANLHGSSWCFQCPQFMGRPTRFDRDHERSMCRECTPDYVQDESTEQCSESSCFLQERKLGNDFCQDCQDGQYYNSTIDRGTEDNPKSFRQDRCIPCQKDTYFAKSEHSKAIDKCFPCQAGTYQKYSGQSSCVLCDRGGYCSSSTKISNGTFSTPCPKGTYNELTGQSGRESCKPCPTRLYSELGSTTCSYCSEGHLVNSDFVKGLLELSSESNSNVFTYTNTSDGSTVQITSDELPDLSNYSWDESFFTYFNEKEFIFQSQSAHEDICTPCPENAKCNFDTTLSTLGVPGKYWRDSQDTKVLYSCDGYERCVGNWDDTSSNAYCAEGYDGPLCKVCVDESHYFSESNGECLKCPSPSLIVLKTSAIILGAIFLIAVARLCRNRFQSLRTHGFQTKIKILVSFYQVASVFQDVYGMRFDEDLSKIMDFVLRFTFGIVDAFPIPPDCMGSKKVQLLFILLSPIAVILLAEIGLVFMQRLLSRWKADKDSNEVSRSFSLSTLFSFEGRTRYVNIIIIVLYLVLPGVSNSIFSVIQCEHFVTKDEPEKEFRAYLIDDMSIQCDRSSYDYHELLVIFWVSVVFWLLLVFIFWALLLSRIWHPVRTNHFTPLANACRFIWIDYEPSMMFWDIFDMIRKIFLTGVIACIDMKSASTEIFRLFIAGTVSLIYVVLLAMSRPYKRADDQCLAVISNVLLTCCFSMGIILNLCDDGVCEDVIGLNSYSASVIMIILTLGTLVISVVFLTAVTYLTITHPTLELKSGEKPNLVLDDITSNCEYHAFFSHVWSTGQAKSHAIVRKIQLIMPEIRIWLDVDDIHKYGGNLEQAVDESAVFILFYSEGYFASRNCRREIDAAIRLSKPVIIIYEGNEVVLECMKNECSKYCNGNEPYLLQILEHLKENSTPWVNEDIFAAQALKNICTMLLGYLPYYQRYPNELSVGVCVPGELGPVHLTNPVNLLVCRANFGSLEVAHEAKSLLKENDSTLLSIIDPIADAEELDGVLSVKRSELVDSPRQAKPATKQVLILYLNSKIFKDDGEELTFLLKHAINLKIKIVLLHELDLQRSGCEFDVFFHLTPMELLKEPFKIYSRSIAVPLHGHEDFRELGLKRLLHMIGEKKMRKKTDFSQSIRATLGM